MLLHLLPQVRRHRQTGLGQRRADVGVHSRAGTLRSTVAHVVRVLALACNSGLGPLVLSCQTLLARFEWPVPHEVYSLPLAVIGSRPNFVYTSNVDGMFIRSGYPAERVLTTQVGL